MHVNMFGGVHLEKPPALFLSSSFDAKTPPRSDKTAASAASTLASLVAVTGNNSQ